MRNLQVLTGQESGIVIYGTDAILCNWSGIDGLPRVFATGLLGMGEDIPEVGGDRCEDLSEYLDGVTTWSYIAPSYHDDELPVTGTVYQLDDDIVVVAPDNWG